ncbi:protein lifeguard 1-like isoform X2 [Bactrocera dorsalis]|uniref:Protein lifeguard 1-like isoform X2 n=1 Tax=Bactrocera dorsalis TaxID=27457 RepID=A0A6J0RMV7_BACDO|nr:protein lifeguard 1-like isoform X2 [Bactrocera dorsalis]
MYQDHNYDAEGAKSFSFDEESIRKGFIRKVYSILMVQLLITFGIIAIFIYVDAVKDWVHHNIWILSISSVVILVTMICMACCESVSRQTPLNFIFLFLFTLAQSFLLGVLVTYYAASEVMLAIGITAAVCLALTLFAFQTKWDFTMCGGILLVAIVVFLIFGIVGIFIPGEVKTVVHSSIGALIFSIYLIYETQLMMGGKHKYAISPEEYIFAALNLYLDILNIFVHIMRLVNK